MPTYQRWISKFELKPGTWVFVPSNDSIASGVEIKSTIESFWKPPKYYYHLRNGGHVAALKVHYSSNLFIHLDIKDFFGSINKSRITRTLKDPLGYPEARRIARESTVRQPGSNPAKFILPFGFVQSPIIASICLFKSTLGKHLGKLAKSNDVVVSIYMDDIIVSTQNKDKAAQILTDIKKATDKAKFTLNGDKEEGPAQKITSFNIDLSKNHLAITSERIVQFASDYANAENDSRREGFKRYIASINPVQVRMLT